MTKKLLLIAMLISILSSNEIKTLTYSGDVDLAIGDFSKTNLDKVCNITYPSFYKIWEENPIFTLYDVMICVESIKSYAQSLGYYEASVSYNINNQKANINIVKNRLIFINSIDIDKEFEHIINLKTSQKFTTKSFSNTKKDIRKYLSQIGYPKAELDAKAYVDMDLYQVDIVYKIDKNEKQYFGNISIQNDANIDDIYIQKEILFKEGDLYNSLLIDQTYEGLYNFGVYSYIGIEENFDYSSNTIPINLKLNKGAYKETMYSIGYDTDTKGRLKAQYKNDNFLGNLKKFTIGTKINQDGYNIYNTIYIPHIVLDNISFTNDINYEDMDYKSYKQKKLEEQITLSKNIFGIKHSVGLLSEHSKLSSKLKEYESGNYLLNSIFYEAILDKRDYSLSPKNGYYLSFYIENGKKALGSDTDYIKTLTELRYIKTFDKLTTSLKTKIGTLDRDLPIFKHFFAGGDYSNRGYTYQNVGLLDSRDNPYGGLSMIDNSIEFEYNIYENIGLATFFDSTMLSRKANTFNEKFYNSVGVGVRYYTPIGPLRIDLGFPLQKGGFVFHIGIGQVF